MCGYNRGNPPIVGCTWCTKMIPFQFRASPLGATLAGVAFGEARVGAVEPLVPDAVV